MLRAALSISRTKAKSLRSTMTTMTRQLAVKLLEVQQPLVQPNLKLPNQELPKDQALVPVMKPLPPLQTPTTKVCAEDTSKTLQVHII